MRGHLWVLLLVVGVVLSLVPPYAQATPPTQVSYQGELVKDGSPFTGTADFKFIIVSGAQSLWSNDGTSTGGGEPQTSVPLTVTNGLFSVRLGDPTLSMVPVRADSFRSVSDAVLRIWVKTGATFERLIPDQALSSSPFALVAQEAAVADSVRAGGLPDDGDWEQSDGNVYRMSGNVGIGTDAPLTPLHVVRDGVAVVRVENAGGAGGGRSEFEDYSAGTSRLRKYSPSGNASIDISPIAEDGVSLAYVRLFRNTSTTGAKRLEFLLGDGTSTTDARIGVGGDNSFFQLHGGNLGIGTSSPRGLLEVMGGGSPTAALFVKANSGTANQGGIIHHQGSTYGWQEVAQGTGSPSGGRLVFNYVNLDSPSEIVNGGVLNIYANGTTAVNPDPANFLG